MNGATFTFRSSADAPNVKRGAEIDRTVSGGTITVRSAPDPIQGRPQAATKGEANHWRVQPVGFGVGQLV